ncbi:MAG: hypothetical protein CR980_00330 [Propionibacteriales bacterium]|nr:MAG: hypothetical protein CR980_00330 [Propionibacteriales bacterium]
MWQLAAGILGRLTDALVLRLALLSDGLSESLAGSSGRAVGVARLVPNDARPAEAFAGSD